MKAIRVSAHGGPEVLKLEEVPKPTASEGQLLIKVQAIGINPVDTYIRSGTYTAKQLPYTPGFDCAGIVESVGPQVSKFKEGDRVYTSGSVTGTYAEYTVSPVDAVHALPENIAFNQGAGLGIPYATAHRALFGKAQARPGETVLVHGASGGVGLAAVQLATAAGMEVIATSSTPEGQKLVQENGANHVVNHHAENHIEEILKITGNRGVDVVLEMLANVNLAKDLGVAAKFGRIVVIGNRGKIEINPRDAMARDVSILGMTLFNAPAAELQSIHSALFAGLKNGTLRPIVGKEMPLAEASRAHVAVLEPGAYGKIVLVP